jgi:eukaryotic-like serine/threonine-protein kinase
MALQPGTSLGPFEIVALLGAGGMGEVYRAKDTKLGRDVALKILPDSVTHDPERIARFRREAQVLASLNHPNIGAIYGLDEANGSQFLVLELVEGETLADRIVKGPLALDDALAIAKQIAEALEAAHEKGIMHRDLKPANIALTHDGKVKVLDFGLAKAGQGATNASFDLANSPTLTSPAMMTGVGVILGTAAYMSPEQAKGRAADKRSDVWAFGCVLYEMLTGRRAFDGEDVSDTLAAVLRGEPNWSALPKALPRSAETMLRRSLNKDQRHRINDVAVLAFLLETATEPSLHQVAGSGGHRLFRTTIALTAAALVAAVAFGVYFTGRVASSTRQGDSPAHLAIVAAAPIELFPTAGGHSLAISRDGRLVAFAVKDQDGQQRIAVRSLDSDAIRVIANTEGGYAPFWSPRADAIGFFVGGQGGGLRRISLAGGPAQELVSLDQLGRGGTWNDRGDILFATGLAGSGIRRIADTGGATSKVTTPDTAKQEISHRWPVFLPNGRHFLFLARSVRAEGYTICVGSLDSPGIASLVAANSNADYADGHLLFARDGALFAQPFDPRSTQLSGEPRLLAEHVAGNDNAAVFDFSASETGYIVYATGEHTGQLSWKDRTGRTVGRINHALTGGQIAPDDRMIVAEEVDYVKGQRTVWVVDSLRQTKTPLISIRLAEFVPLVFNPIWSHDQTAVAYYVEHDGHRSVRRHAIGQEQGTDLFRGDERMVPTDWTWDGGSLIYTRFSKGILGDIWMFSVSTGENVPLLASDYDERDGRVSPDGRRLTFTSNQSGRAEVYVTEFPTPKSRHQISTAGGSLPRWRGRGDELYFVDGNRMLNVVTLRWRTNGPRLDGPIQLPISVGPQKYDVTADGERFLTDTQPDLIPVSAINVLLNWGAANK